MGITRRVFLSMPADDPGRARCGMVRPTRINLPMTILTCPTHTPEGDHVAEQTPLRFVSISPRLQTKSGRASSPQNLTGSSLQGRTEADLKPGVRMNWVGTGPMVSAASTFAARCSSPSRQPLLQYTFAVCFRTRSPASPIELVPEMRPRGSPSHMISG